MASHDTPLTVDSYDLDQKIWTCSKYRQLHNEYNASCSSVFDSSVKFRVHIRKLHRNLNFPSTFKCPISNCKEKDKLFTRIQHLQNHYDRIHRKEHNFQCKVCAKTFSSSNTWTRHVKNCSSGILKCDFCSRTFSGFSSLSRHCREKHLKEIQKKCSDKSSESLENKLSADGVDSEINAGDSVKYYLVPVQNIVMQPHEDSGHSENICNQSNPSHSSEISADSSHTIEHEQNPYSDCSEAKRLKHSDKISDHIHHAASQANIWNHAPSQTPIWCNDSSTSPDKNTTRSWPSHHDQAVQNSYPELRKPLVGGFEDTLQSKQFLSAIDTITTQTEEFWELNEFSTQTDTEHNSFGTQTRCPNDGVLDPFISDCELVEYLDGEVQTDTFMKRDSATLTSQTSISTESFTNDRSCGVDRLDRDCQTNYFKNSTHTQTKMRRERSLVVVDGLNTETQTASPEQISSIYNESFTQTIDDVF